MARANRYADDPQGNRDRIAWLDASACGMNRTREALLPPGGVKSLEGGHGTMRAGTQVSSGVLPWGGSPCMHAFPGLSHGRIEVQEKIAR